MGLSSEEISKWRRVKEELEKASKQKSYFYWLACEKLGVEPGYERDVE